MPRLIDLCKGRYPIGLFLFDKALWSDKGVCQAAGTGADFFVTTESSEPLYRLCEKYGLGIISSSNTSPGWWGGDGKNAGGYATHFPVERLDEIQKNYPQSPALWGDYPVDEPNAKDFAHIDKVLKRYGELFPDKLPFLNLYPSYGSLPKNTSAEIAAQLGNGTYAGHIGQYIQEIDLPYICFDYYPFTGTSVFLSYLENLDVVARACRRSKKEMWVIIQAGAWKAEEMPKGHQIDWQVYVCLAYGARALIYANYSKGWWHEATACADPDGNPTPTYGYVKSINSVLHSPLGPAFLEYMHIHTEVCGDISSSDKRMRPQLTKQNANPKPSRLSNVAIHSDKAVIAGYFVKSDGWAIMIVNAHNPFDSSISASVRLTTADKRHIRILGGSKVSGSVLSSGAFSTVELTLESGQGAFVIFT